MARKDLLPPLLSKPIEGRCRSSGPREETFKAIAGLEKRIREGLDQAQGSRHGLCIAPSLQPVMIRCEMGTGDGGFVGRQSCAHTQPHFREGRGELCRQVVDWIGPHHDHRVHLPFAHLFDESGKGTIITLLLKAGTGEIHRVALVAEQVVDAGGEDLRVQLVHAAEHQAGTFVLQQRVSQGFGLGAEIIP